MEVAFCWVRVVPAARGGVAVLAAVSLGPPTPAVGAEGAAVSTAMAMLSAGAASADAADATAGASADGESAALSGGGAASRSAAPLPPFVASSSPGPPLHVARAYIDRVSGDPGPPAVIGHSCHPRNRRCSRVKA